MVEQYPGQIEHETRIAQVHREELIARIAQVMRVDGTMQPREGLHLYRQSLPQQVHGVVDPSLCVIAQGSKEVLVGEHRYRYDPMHYLLATLDLPHVSQIRDASPERPYLAIRLQLSSALVSSVITEIPAPVIASPADVRAIAVTPLDTSLLDALVRLVRLLDCPSEAQVLMPLITREIIYRLLMGEHGGRLRHLAVQGGYSPHIAKAIERIAAHVTGCTDSGMSLSYVSGDSTYPVSPAPTAGGRVIEGDSHDR